MSNKRKKCRLLQNLYSIFLLNSKKRKKCRTKRKKCRLFKISIRHFFLNNKKRKKCRTIRHFCIRHFFIDSIILGLPESGCGNRKETFSHIQSVHQNPADRIGTRVKYLIYFRPLQSLPS